MNRTNSYVINRIIKKEVKRKNWKIFTVLELKAFHEVIIYMSIKSNLGGIKSYWDHGPWGDDYIKTIFTLHRFKSLIHNLHVIDAIDISPSDDSKDFTLKVKW